ncbi:hypothetical protein, partial [Pseudomonas fragi]|uniref:hypothetical protein n=1 Tax=Pseudomonas fragi TaxID=296 RepID=UPI001E52B867
MFHVITLSAWPGTSTGALPGQVSGNTSRASGRHVTLKIRQASNAENSSKPDTVRRKKRGMGSAYDVTESSRTYPTAVRHSKTL